MSPNIFDPERPSSSPMPQTLEARPAPSGVVGGCSGPPQGMLNSQSSLETVVWSDSVPVRENYEVLGKALNKSPDLYRNGSDGCGLIRVLPSGEAEHISTGKGLAPLVADRVDVTIITGEKAKRDLPPEKHLNGVLRSDAFLNQFPPVDLVTREPYYRDDFTLIPPGFHDGGPGQRVLYVGPPPAISESIETITRFVDAMPFATNADRTNAVAGALTVRLRRFWPGQKPLVLCTAPKSHSGKGTTIDFIRGAVPKADILFESQDWPMCVQFQRQLKQTPDIGVLDFDNVRLDSSGGGRMIRSAFIESFVTAKEIVLASPGAGDPIRVENHFVVLINTNDGKVSIDMLNRALSVHLAPHGSLQDQESPIGNPKYEFLPKHQEQIEAELMGMIERWQLAGRPLDLSTRHPMIEWAHVIGGIMSLNGFTDFLGNRNDRRTADDPVREAVALLGAARPNVALRPAEWADLAVELGLATTIFPANQRNNAVARERLIGVLLKPLCGEFFDVVTDTHRIRLRLDGGLRRWKPRNSPHQRYVLEVVTSEPLPLDEVPDGSGKAGG